MIERSATGFYVGISNLPFSVSPFSQGSRLVIPTFCTGMSVGAGLGYARALDEESLIFLTADGNNLLWTDFPTSGATVRLQGSYLTDDA